MSIASKTIFKQSVKAAFVFTLLGIGAGAPLPAVSAIEMTPALRQIVDGARREGKLVLESPPN